MPSLPVNNVGRYTRRALLMTPAALTVCCMRAAPPRQIPGLVFECGIELASGRLRVSYSLRNGSSGEIGVITPLAGSSGPCYIDVDGPTLLLEQFVLPIPFGLQTTMQPVPYASRVPTGRTHTAEFSLAEPMAVNNPYRRAQLAAQSVGTNITANRRRELRDTMFSVGVFEAGPSLRFTPEPQAGKGLHTVWPPAAAIEKQVILSKRVTLRSTVTVLDY